MIDLFFLFSFVAGPHRSLRRLAMPPLSPARLPAVALLLALPGAAASVLALPGAAAAGGARAFYVLFANQVTDNPRWPLVCQNNGVGPQGGECANITDYAGGVVILSPQIAATPTPKRSALSSRRQPGGGGGGCCCCCGGGPPTSSTTRKASGGVLPASRCGAAARAAARCSARASPPGGGEDRSMRCEGGPCKSASGGSISLAFQPPDSETR
jgi:hypothetical protein